MRRRPTTDLDEPRTLRPPAKTPEEREQQLIAYAADLAERQMVDGSASAQVITHYLKLGSSRERLEQERLRRENILLGAKAEAMESAQRMEALYADAINAMRAYGGHDPIEPPPGGDDDPDGY